MFKVTNGNLFNFVGRYNGVDYAFPVNEPAYCEDDAAAHIFGIGVTDKTAVLARHGWANFTSSVAAGMRVLNNFSFEHMDLPLDAPLARELALAAPTDHGSAPVVQNAPAVEGGADEPVEAAGAVVAQPVAGAVLAGPEKPGKPEKPKRPPEFGRAFEPATPEPIE